MCGDEHQTWARRASVELKGHAWGSYATLLQNWDLVCMRISVSQLLCVIQLQRGTRWRVWLRYCAVRSQFILREFWGGQSVSGKVFSPITSDFHWQCHSTNDLYSIIHLSSPSSSVTSQALPDLFGPSLIVSSEVFHVVFVHLVYNSALFLASCCCWFLLHVVANLIYASIYHRTYTGWLK